MSRTYIIIALLALASYEHVQAALVAEQEPNDSLSGAQFIPASSFDLISSPDIGDSVGTNTSTMIPHVTIDATGNGTYDYYSFQVYNPNDVGIFDIDYGLNQGGSVDIEIALWNATGGKLAENDDFAKAAGAGGSVHHYDSFIQYSFPTAGLYVVGVAEYSATGNATGWTGGIPDVGDTYTLQISLPVPEPTSGSPAMIGMCLLGLHRLRKQLWAA